MKSEFATLKLAAIGMGTVALIGLAIWWEISVWNECRADHSWLYCVRVLNK